VLVKYHVKSAKSLYTYDYRCCACAISCEVYQVTVHLGLSIEAVYKANVNPLVKVHIKRLVESNKAEYDVYANQV
jgi:hypothetical protein